MNFQSAKKQLEGLDFKFDADQFCPIEMLEGREAPNNDGQAVLSRRGNCFAAAITAAALINLELRTDLAKVFLDHSLFSTNIHFGAILPSGEILDAFPWLEVRSSQDYIRCTYGEVPNSAELADTLQFATLNSGQVCPFTTQKHEGIIERQFTVLPVEQWLTEALNVGIVDATLPALNKSLLAL